MYNDKYELNIAINGKTVKEYFDKGKFFVEARQNSEYSLKLKNHSHKKIMAVFSVDGIDVLKGGNANEAQSGYIINPYSHVTINGYRIDDDNVATFKFDDGKTSYSTQVKYEFNQKKLDKVKKGKLAPSKQNGVIGVRIWEEKEPLIIPNWNEFFNNKSSYYHNQYSSAIIGSGINYAMSISGCSNPITGYANMPSFSGATLPAQSNLGAIGQVSSNVIPIVNSSNASFANAGLPMGQCMYNGVIYAYNAMNTVSTNTNYTPNFNVGTSWGNKVEDKVIKTNFEKADSHIDLEIYYLERQELINLGIDFDTTKKVFISGFPKAFESEEYCKQPNNWRKN